MAPNLFVALQTAVSPRRWFNRPNPTPGTSATTLSKTEHWSSPVPGTYTYKPGVGWYLTSLDSDPTQPTTPQRVIDVPALDRAMLLKDYYRRSMIAAMPGAPPGSPELGWVRCSDNIAWVNDRDADGKPTKGPWQRFVIDKETKELRLMCKGDDPAWHSKRNSPSHSARSSVVDKGGHPPAAGSHSKSNSKSSVEVAKTQADCADTSGPSRRGRPRAHDLISAPGSAASSRAPSPMAGATSAGASRPVSLLSPSSRAASPSRRHSPVEGNTSKGSSAGPSRPHSLRMNSASHISSPLASPAVNTQDGDLAVKVGERLKEIPRSPS